MFWCRVEPGALQPPSSLWDQVQRLLSHFPTRLWPLTSDLPPSFRSVTSQSLLPPPLPPKSPTDSSLPLISLAGWAPSELKSTSQLHFDLWPPCLAAPATHSGLNSTCHSLTSHPLSPALSFVSHIPTVLLNTPAWWMSSRGKWEEDMARSAVVKKRDLFIFF